jgi:AI-2 transport system permease protein
MKRKLTNLILKRPEVLTITIILIYFLGTGLINPAFLALDTLVRILFNGAMLFLVTMGIAGVLITRNIDASVGSLLGLAATFGATYLLTPNPSIVVFLLITLGTGLAGGVFNGIGIAYAGVPSIIMTLGTMAMFRGILTLYTGGSWIDTVPEWYLNFSRTEVLGLFYPIWLMLIFLVILWFFYNKVTWGRYLYATGNSTEGARLQGVPVKKVILSAFAISGLFSGFGALIFISQIGTIPTQAGIGMEIQAIAAAVIGGISLMGGAGNIQGAALGAMLLETIKYSLVYFKVPGYWNNVISGFLLLLIVVLTSRIQIFLRREKEREKEEMMDVASTAQISLMREREKEKCRELEKQVIEQWNLRDALVIPEVDRMMVNRNLGVAGAQYIELNLKKEDILIGFGFGNTISLLLKHLSLQEYDKVSLVALAGGITACLQTIYREDINPLSRFKDRFHIILSPLLVTSEETCRSILKEPEIARIIQRAEMADIAIVGIGPMSSEATYVSFGYLTPQEFEFLQKQGAVGDILGQFYDKDGQKLDVEYHNRLIAVKLEKLKNMPHVIGIAGGEHKVDAIRGALSGGYIQSLITDERTALKLLESTAFQRAEQEEGRQVEPGEVSYVTN